MTIRASESSRSAAHGVFLITVALVLGVVFVARTIEMLVDDTPSFLIRDRLDPVIFFLKESHMRGVAFLVEGTTTALLLIRCSAAIKLRAVLLLGSAFTGYHLFSMLLGVDTGCGCLPRSLGIPGRGVAVAEALASGFALYMLIGSGWLLVLRRRGEDSKHLPEGSALPAARR